MKRPKMPQSAAAAAAAAAATAADEKPQAPLERMSAPMCPLCGRPFENTKRFVEHVNGEGRWPCEQRAQASEAGRHTLRSMPDPLRERLEAHLQEGDDSGDDDDDHVDSGGSDGGDASAAGVEGADDDALREDRKPRRAAYAAEWATTLAEEGSRRAVGSQVHLLLTNAAPYGFGADGAAAVALRHAQQNALLHRLCVAPALPWTTSNGWRPPNLRWLLELSQRAAEERLSDGGSGGGGDGGEAGKLLCYSVRLLRADQAQRLRREKRQEGERRGKGSPSLLERLWRTVDPKDARLACRTVAEAACSVWHSHAAEAFLPAARWRGSGNSSGVAPATAEPVESLHQAQCMDVCAAASDLLSMVAREAATQYHGVDKLITSQLHDAWDSGLGTSAASRKLDAYLCRRFRNSLHDCGADLWPDL